MRRLWALTGAVMLVASSVAAGVKYESSTRTVDEDGDTQQVFIVTSWVDGDNARIEFREAKGGPVPDEAYMITNDGGQTIYMVNPEEQSYMEWDLDRMFQALGDMQEATGGMVSMDFTDTSAEYEGSSAGGEILGYDTTKHTMKSEFTMQIKVFGMKQSTTMKTTTEAWMTDELTAPGFGAWLRETPPKTGDAEFDAMLDGMAARLDGVALKSVSNTVSTDQKGRESRSTSTTEVTSIEETDIDPSMFQIPDGYEKVEMPAMGGAEGGEDEPSGLGGLFKKIGG
jgi:hypothetical protein